MHKLILKTFLFLSIVTNVSQSMEQENEKCTNTYSTIFYSFNTNGISQQELSVINISEILSQTKLQILTSQQNNKTTKQQNNKTTKQQNNKILLDNCFKISSSQSFLQLRYKMAEFETNKTIPLSNSPNRSTINLQELEINISSKNTESQSPFLIQIKPKYKKENLSMYCQQETLIESTYLYDNSRRRHFEYLRTTCN